MKNFTSFGYLVEIGVLKTDDHGIIIFKDKQEFAGTGKFRKNAYFIWLIYSMMKKHPILSAVLRYINFDLELMIELSNKLPNESKRPDAVIGGVALYLDEDHNAE